MRYCYFSSLLLLLLVARGCNKDNKALFKHSGIWEIQSMQLDYLNASGAVDSTVSAGISGFFMFYNTPTEGSDQWYLSTNGMTVKGREHHSAHFWQAGGGELRLVKAITQSIPDRSYTISDDKGDGMTLDYMGPAGDFYASYLGKVKEHIVLHRIKFD